MYGWRARIGILVVASDVTCESELYRVIPDGVSIHTSRMRFPGAVNAETCAQLALEAESAAELLVPACVNTIAFCCTSGSFIRGAGWDREIIEKIEKRFPDINVTTTSSAVLAAFQRLNVKKIAVATPYITEVNKALKTFFEGMAISVLNIEGLEIEGDQDVNNLSPETAYRLARKVDIPEADAVFISCTSVRTIEVIAALEKDLGKPVISSNQATIWHALRKARIPESIEGYGRLFTLP